MSFEVITLKSRKFLVLAVCAIALIAVISGVVIAVTGSGKEPVKSSVSTENATEISGANNADLTTGTAPGTNENAVAPSSSAGPVVDCPNNDNGICTKTGEPCTNCINADVTTGTAPGTNEP